MVKFVAGEAEIAEDEIVLGKAAVDIGFEPAVVLHPSASVLPMMTDVIATLELVEPGGLCDHGAKKERGHKGENTMASAHDDVPGTFAPELDSGGVGRDTLDVDGGCLTSYPRSHPSRMPWYRRSSGTGYISAVPRCIANTPGRRNRQSRFLQGAFRRECSR